MNQMDLTDIYRTFYPKTKEYIFFLGPHDTFSKVDYIVSYKIDLNKYKKIKITKDILSDHMN